MKRKIVDLFGSVQEKELKLNLKVKTILAIALCLGIGGIGFAAGRITTPVQVTAEDVAEATDSDVSTSDESNSVDGEFGPNHFFTSIEDAKSYVNDMFYARALTLSKEIALDSITDTETLSNLKKRFIDSFNEDVISRCYLVERVANGHSTLPSGQVATAYKENTKSLSDSASSKDFDYFLDWLYNAESGSELDRLINQTVAENF